MSRIVLSQLGRAKLRYECLLYQGVKKSITDELGFNFYTIQYAVDGTQPLSEQKFTKVADLLGKPIEYFTDDSTEPDDPLVSGWLLNTIKQKDAFKETKNYPEDYFVRDSKGHAKLGKEAKERLYVSLSRMGRAKLAVECILKYKSIYVASAKAGFRTSYLPEKISTNAHMKLSHFITAAKCLGMSCEYFMNDDWPVTDAKLYDSVLQMLESNDEMWMYLGKHCDTPKGVV